MFGSLFHLLLQLLQALFRDANIPLRGLIRFLLEAVKNVDGALHSHLQQPVPEVSILSPQFEYPA
jgi:hypothetical protein